MEFSVSGIGAWGPGFHDWASLRAILTGEENEGNKEFSSPQPDSIPARERRRAPLSVKLAVEVASQACGMAGLQPAETACVFASSMGDMDITDYMCRTVVSDQPAVSPTRFHNSVHNAPVAYWSISGGCMLSSNAVAAGENTVAVSLLEAINQCCMEKTPVLWASQDIASPLPFRCIFEIDQPCAFSLLIKPGSGDGIRPFYARLEPGDGTWMKCKTPALSHLYETNPTARILGLLEALGADPASDAFRLPLNHHLDLWLESL